MKPVDESNPQAPDGEAAGGADSFDALLRQAAHVSAPAPTRALLPAGTTLAGGRLSVLRRIGEGGMGVVYEAHDAQRKGRVALKTLPRIDAVGVYRLKNEFRALADVAHENLVRLHELFAEGETWFFTMELVDGARFDAWVRPGGELDEARLRAALPQLVAAVGAIHAAGKLHRDLKPSNVLVTGEGRVAVLDFGLAVDPELGGVGQTVADDSVSGTPAYMAPEQAAGQAATAASDCYALGVMLFEALTGRLPFEGRTHEIIIDKQRKPAPRARSLAPQAPAELDALCVELLAREPAARPDLAALHARLPLHPPGADRTPSGSRSSRGGSERSPALAAESAPELFGRETELVQFREAFAATLSGTPVVLFVSGESGMGKSALCEAFLHELRAQGRATVLSGRCYERENVPYKAFDPLVDDLSRHLRRVPEREAAALLPRDVHALARLFPALARVAVVAEAPRREIADPLEVQRRAFDAFGEMLARLRDRQPLVVFIDDLQWTDQDSVRFMRHLLLRSDPVPALLLATHRSEGAEQNALLASLLEAASDNRALSLRSLRVGPLSASARMTLARKLLGASEGDPRARAVAEESGGSPFFAHTLAHAAQRGASGLSLHEAVSAQVAALGDGARRILQALAHAGQPLPASVVLGAVSLSHGHGDLDVLRGERLLRVSGAGDAERGLECYHDKIREVVSEALPRLLARELSAGLARALSSWPGADPELLTRCLESAGERQQAGEHAAAAADAALDALAFDRAARLYDKAIELGAFEPARLQALRVARAHALARAGRGVIAAEAYLAAREGAEGDAHAELSHLAAAQFMICGQLDRGRALMVEALRSHGIGYPTSLAGTLAAFAYQRGRLRMRGLRFEPRANIDPSTVRRLEALELVTHVIVRSDLARCGAFTARWLREALDAGHLVSAARATGWELCLATAVGVPSERLEALVALAGALCARTDDPTAHNNMHNGRGWAGWFRGKPAAALADFDDMLARCVAHPEMEHASYDKPWIEWLRGGALFELGRFDLAAAPWLAQLERCWAGGDMTLLPALVGFIQIYSLLAVGRDLEFERELARVEAVWSPSELTQQDIWLALARACLHLWRGEVPAAWRVAETLDQKMRASAIGRVVTGGIDFAAGTCGPGYARTLPEGSERRALVRRIARAASVLARREARGSTYPTMRAVGLHAAHACLQGRPERAIELLRAFVTGDGQPRAEGAPLYVECARRRLGELLGGDEGAALIAEAEAFLRKGGALDPARLVSLLMPGIERA